MWKPVIIAAGALIALTGCTTPASPTASSGPTPAAMLFAVAAQLDQAEVLATAYTSSPLADPTVKATIKSLDNTAYSAVHPVLDAAKAGQSPVTAAKAEAAQAAFSALAKYMLTHGVK